MPKYYSAAKINLFLQVEAKRADGYHDLTSVMQSVSLFDEVDIAFHQPEFRLDCGGAELGSTEKNTVTRMWRLLKEKYDLPGEIAVTLKKQIPVGAGLGGGSGNGAAILKAVMDEFELTLTKEEIIEVAATIGADVAFCFFGGTMLATGIGEKLRPLKPLPDWDILLFHGGFHISTADIFKAYDDIALGIGKVPADVMVHALERESRDGVLYALYNGLEKVTFPKYAALRQLSDELNDLFLPHLMSGSGPTVFALASRQQAKNLQKEYAQKGKVFYTRPVDKGIYSEAERQSLPCLKE